MKATAKPPAAQTVETPPATQGEAAPAAPIGDTVVISETVVGEATEAAAGSPAPAMLREAATIAAAGPAANAAARSAGLPPCAPTPGTRKIAAGINAAAPLAPTGLAAAVLLSHDRRALSETEILDRAEFLHMAAVDNGAHGGKEPIRPLVLNAVESLCSDGTLKRHEAGGERFYAVPEERRIALDYHKNGILHFLLRRFRDSSNDILSSWIM